MKKNSNNIGIKDIAEKARVSIGTVDRVLHDRGEVAVSTRNEVLKIIEELEYTPNILAKSLASKKKYTIAILIPDNKNNNPYWEKPLLGINNAANEIKNYNFEISVFTFELGNEKSFETSVSKVLKLRPSGLIFAPVMYKVSLNVIDQCEKLNIPYVFFDVDIEACSNLAYFGQNSFQSGYVAARLMDYGLPDKSDIHILKLVNKKVSTYHLGLRENGFNSYFKESGKHKRLNIKSSEIEISAKTLLNKEFDKILNYSMEPKGIFVPNSRVYHIAKYLFDAKQKNHVVIGYDLINENVEYLNKGSIQFLICQNPEDQGYNSVIALFNYLLLKKPIEKSNFSPIDIIMKENIDYYKKIKNYNK